MKHTLIEYKAQENDFTDNGKERVLKNSLFERIVGRKPVFSEKIYQSSLDFGEIGKDGYYKKRPTHKSWWLLTQN